MAKDSCGLEGSRVYLYVPQGRTSGNMALPGMTLERDSVDNGTFFVQIYK